MERRCYFSYKGKDQVVLASAAGGVLVHMRLARRL
jgi:hypothetical protein